MDPKRSVFSTNTNKLNNVEIGDNSILVGDGKSAINYDQTSNKLTIDKLSK